MLDNKLQQGTALYLSLMIMTILLSIALGLSTIFIGQSKMIRALGNSVIAFYAADAGVEEVLINRTNPSVIPQTSLPNGAMYQVFVTAGGVGDCASDNNFCIKSIGVYQETRRAIEIVY